MHDQNQRGIRDGRSDQPGARFVDGQSQVSDRIEVEIFKGAHGRDQSPQYGQVLQTGGHPEFDRIFRVQMNTLEWMPIFLPLLWLFAFYVSDIAAAALGLVWIAARMLYVVRYAEAAGRRGFGFTVQGAVCVVLLVGALAGIVNNFAHGG